MSSQTLSTFVFCMNIAVLVSGLELASSRFRLFGAEFTVDNVKNFYQCIKLCEMRSLCKSVNYNPKTKVCTSNSEDSSNRVNTTSMVSGYKESVFADKYSVLQKKNYVCKDEPCNEMELCAQIGSQAKCLSEVSGTYCGKPHSFQNAVATLTKMSGYLQATYSCKRGFASDNLKHNLTSRCSETGNWTDVSLNCIIDCGVLKVGNGTFLTKYTTIGSIGSVVCNEQFQSFGNSSSAVCNLNGKWEGFSGRCLQVEWRNQGINVTAVIPVTIKKGWQLLLNGTPATSYNPDTLEAHWKEATSLWEGRHFEITLRNSTDIQMIMDVLFYNRRDYRNVVFNRKINGQWNEPLRFANHELFPFVKLKKFMLHILLMDKVFRITVDGKNLYNCTHSELYEYSDRVIITNHVVVNKLTFIYP